jgi:hypothetical protein
MVYNERKRQTFEFFARREWVEVPVYAVGVGMYPIRSCYRYSKKLHMYNYLWRGRNIHSFSCLDRSCTDKPSSSNCHQLSLYTRRYRAILSDLEWRRLS